MSSRILFFCFQVLACSLLAEDAAQPTIKKEKLPKIPHVWFSEGAMVLKAKESGFAFANKSQNVSTTTDFLKSSIVQPRFAWNGGLQINMGYQPKNWFFFANWMYIENKAKGKSSTDGSSGFFPILSLDPTNTPDTYVTSGNVFWRLDTHLGDIGTIISWHPTKWFILKSHAALRLASLNQKSSANYGGGKFNQGIDMSSMNNYFFGGGPRFGLSPVIALPKGFSLVGDVAGAGLLGGFWVHQKETYLDQLLFHDSHKMARFRWNLEAKAALAWQMDIVYKALVFCVQAGWEWHEFFHQNELQYNQFGFFNDNRNIILQGGFLSACLGF